MKVYLITATMLDAEKYGFTPTECTCGIYNNREDALKVVRALANTSEFYMGEYTEYIDEEFDYANCSYSTTDYALGTMFVIEAYTLNEFCEPCL